MVSMCDFLSLFLHVIIFCDGGLLCGVEHYLDAWHQVLPMTRSFHSSTVSIRQKVRSFLNIIFTIDPYSRPCVESYHQNSVPIRSINFSSAYLLSDKHNAFYT